MPDRSCCVCGGSIDPRRRPNTKYCTPACANKAWRQRVASGEAPPAGRVCEQCGVSIDGHRRDSRTCSKNCSQLAWYYRTRVVPGHIERACPACDEPIKVGSHANRVYCSVTCRNVVKIIQSHGLTVEQYRSMLASQSGACAICGGDEQWKPDDRGWHIDHDHETGKVRGILCPACNLMLGYAKDKPAALRAAAAYLERSSAIP